MYIDRYMDTDTQYSHTSHSPALFPRLYVPAPRSASLSCAAGRCALASGIQGSAPESRHEGPKSVGDTHVHIYVLYVVIHLHI